MGRPKKSVADTFYDVFADFPLEDQTAALQILTQVHRLAQREARRRRNGIEELPTTQASIPLDENEEVQP